MANFYVSSVAYAAIAPWAATTTYTIGQIIRPTAAVAGRKVAYRCTTGGTSAGAEPTWGLTFGGTTTSNTAVFTAINSDTYGWTGAAGDISTVTNVLTSSFATAGDKIFLSSDHSEVTAASTDWTTNIGGSWTTVTTFILCANRAGSVPPVAADLTTGASISFQIMYINTTKPLYIQGVTLIASSTNIIFDNVGSGSSYLKNCMLSITNASTGNRLLIESPGGVVLDNTTISFANSSQGISSGSDSQLTWMSTPSALAGTMTSSLFLTASGNSFLVMLRGVDLSFLTGNILSYVANSVVSILLDSCRISASATMLTGTPAGDSLSVELVNCWDGTNVRNERYTTGGSTVTERTITLTGGAADDVGSFSLKMVSGSARIDKWVGPIASFWIDVENTAVGVSKTATVEIVSSASFNNDDIWLLLEYMGTAGNPIASFVDSNPVTPLTAAAAVTTSTAPWNSSPATPVYQHLQVTFTPQRAGRVRGRVMLGKASATVYVDPNIVIT